MSGSASSTTSAALGELRGEAGGADARVAQRRDARRVEVVGRDGVAEANETPRQRGADRAGAEDTAGLRLRPFTVCIQARCHAEFEPGRSAGQRNRRDQLVDQPLRFGTYVEFQCPPGADHAELIWDVVSLGEHADRAGFDVFTCLEHPWFEQFAIMPAPLPLFTTLAQRTSNLTFRAMCHTLPLHNPFVLAGEIATADILLNGRFEVGVGRGHAWLQESANIVHRGERRALPRMPGHPRAGVEPGPLLLRRHLLHGRDLSVVPKPLQRPHPKIFQVGTSAKWFQRAAEKSYGVVLGGPAPTEVFREPAKLYRQLCEEAGTDPYLGWIKAIYLDEDEDRAMEEGREAALNFIAYNVSPLQSLARTTPEEKQRLIDAGYAFYAADDFADTGNLTFEQLIEYGIVLVGTPEKVGRQLLDLWDEFRFEELLIISHFGGTERWQSLKTQQLFARGVMPMLREAAASASVA